MQENLGLILIDKLNLHRKEQILDALWCKFRIAASIGPNLHW